MTNWLMNAVKTFIRRQRSSFVTDDDLMATPRHEADCAGPQHREVNAPMALFDDVLILELERSLDVQALGYEDGVANGTSDDCARGAGEVRDRFVCTYEKIRARLQAASWGMKLAQLRTQGMSDKLQAELELWVSQIEDKIKKIDAEIASAAQEKGVLVGPACAAYRRAYLLGMMQGNEVFATLRGAGGPR